MTSTAPTANRPPLGLIFESLLRAEIAGLRRNLRLQVVNVVLPLVVLGSSWLQLRGTHVTTNTAAIFVGNAITAAPLATGVLGYAPNVVRDRESGVFQRLRVTPAPTWAIMVSRLIPPVVMNILVAVVVGTLGAIAFKLPIDAALYLPMVPAAILAGAVFLSLGQALAALLTSGQVSAISRVVFIVLYLAGLLGLNGGLGAQFKSIARWTPVGSTVELFHTIVAHGAWATVDTIAIVASLGYIAVFAFVGIRYFRWITG